MTPPNYVLEYDESLDALCSLELLVEQIPRVIAAPLQWKWVLLSLHNSMQGFMVLALQGTNALSVLTPEDAKAWSEAYEAGTVPTKPPKLDPFMRLYSKIKSDAMILRGDSKVFEPSPTQDGNVGRLNAFRNEFMHYIPATSVLDMRGWARMLSDVIHIIGFLVAESNNVVFFEDSVRERVLGLCQIAENQALAIKDCYGA